MVTINSVWFSGNDICVEMSDGKIIQNSIKSYPNLSKGTADQIKKYEINYISSKQKTRQY